jgi:hypothetical protein
MENGARIEGPGAAWEFLRKNWDLRWDPPAGRQSNRRPSRPGTALMGRAHRQSPGLIRSRSKPRKARESLSGRNAGRDFLRVDRALVKASSAHRQKQNDRTRPQNRLEDSKPRNRREQWLAGCAPNAAEDLTNQRRSAEELQKKWTLRKIYPQLAAEMLGPRSNGN